MMTGIVGPLGDSGGVSRVTTHVEVEDPCWEGARVVGVLRGPNGDVLGFGPFAVHGCTCNEPWRVVRELRPVGEHRR